MWQNEICRIWLEIKTLGSNMFSRWFEMIENIYTYKLNYGLNLEIIHGRNEFHNQLGQSIIAPQ